MAQLTLPPDYFRNAAEKFAANPSNRKVWLSDQIQKASESLIAYKKELDEMVSELARLGATKESMPGLAIVGGVLAAIPSGYTQVIGGLVIVASSFLKKIENKANNKRIADLVTVYNARYSEALVVGRYYDTYTKELQRLRLIPYILTAVFIYLILN